jgi:hypothetical protein
MIDSSSYLAHKRGKKKGVLTLNGPFEQRRYEERKKRAETQTDEP